MYYEYVNEFVRRVNRESPANYKGNPDNMINKIL